MIETLCYICRFRMYSLETKAIEIFAKRMLDVNFKDCITSEWVSNYQTNEAEDNVIIEKFERKI